MTTDNTQNPVAWCSANLNDIGFQKTKLKCVPLYTTPQAVPTLVDSVELPTEASEAANDAIRAMLKEYDHPSSPQNAGRAGWRAARLYASHPAPPEQAK
jgi:hypothetical protein